LLSRMTQRTNSRSDLENCRSKSKFSETISKRAVATRAKIRSHYFLRNKISLSNSYVRVM
jgi:hypothetical protein